MGYGQYGGVGFRDGKRIETLSDVMLTPDLNNHGTPGAYPTAPAGMDDATFSALREKSVFAHVVLGAGPVFVSLHKNSRFEIHVLENGAFRELSDVDLATCGVDLSEDIIQVDEEGEDEGVRKVDRWLLADMDGHEGRVRFETRGHVIEYRMMRIGGFVQHIRLTQPDGTVWSGFSGSEIGAGWDEEDTLPHLERHETVFD